MTEDLFTRYGQLFCPRSWKSTQHLHSGRVDMFDPPNDKSSYAGGSQFGCPKDAFDETQIMQSSQASSPDGSWQVKENSPRGFSRLIDHPTWLSGGCPIPCADTYTYND